MVIKASPLKPNELINIHFEPGTPYLIELGLSKSLTATALLAAPLSGLIVQPMIGTCM